MDGKLQSSTTTTLPSSSSSSPSFPPYSLSQSALQAMASRNNANKSNAPPPPWKLSHDPNREVQKYHLVKRSIGQPSQGFLLQTYVTTDQLTPFEKRALDAGRDLGGRTMGGKGGGKKGGGKKGGGNAAKGANKRPNDKETKPASLKKKRVEGRVAVYVVLNNEGLGKVRRKERGERRSSP
jgi:hypothetical protein